MGKDGANWIGINIGFTGGLFLLFLGLKLGKVIDWSWWFIFMPLYAVPVLAIIAFLIIMLVVFIMKKLN